MRLLIKSFLIVFCCSVVLSACGKGVGCPTKSFTTSMKTKKHGSSNLFSKDMRRRAGN